MSDQRIKRRFRSIPITLSTATAVATTIRWDDVAGGTLLMGTSSTNVSTLQIWASDTPTGTFGRLYKVDGSVADITLSASSTQPRIYSLPDETYGCGAIKVVSATTNSTSATAVVCLKS